MGESKISIPRTASSAPPIIASIISIQARPMPPKGKISIFIPGERQFSILEISPLGTFLYPWRPKTSQMAIIIPLHYMQIIVGKNKIHPIFPISFSQSLFNVIAWE